MFMMSELVPSIGDDNCRTISPNDMDFQVSITQKTVSDSRDNTNIPSPKNTSDTIFAPILFEDLLISIMIAQGRRAVLCN